MTKTALRALLLFALLALPIAAAQSAMTLSIFSNATTISAGNTLRVGISGFNQGPAFNADFYFGVIHPDAITATFVVNLAPLTGVVRRLDGNPQTLPALAANIAVPQSAVINLPDFFVYTLSSEPVGRYTFFAALTPPGAFQDGVIGNSDFIVLDTRSIDVMPRPQGGSCGGARC